MRWNIGSIPIDALTMGAAIDAIVSLARSGEGGTVFTPNIDHVVLAEEDPEFREAYARASVSLVDGMPVFWATKLLDRPVPEKVSGSDLVHPLLRRAAMENLRVYLLGGAAEDCARKLRTDYPSLAIAGTDSARIDRGGNLDEVAKRIRDAKADIVLVALGAPKQEIVSHRLSKDVKPAVLVGVGAAIDFIAGRQKRAPAWMSRVGLEWFYRLARDPKRLWRRYLLRDPKFFFVLVRELAR
jgi:N-acetylglucosaminyldiphosphoundecaprenol N-acetyl-beta-D-mannosaminyltransferase